MQSPHKETSSEKSYDPSPKRKFSLRLDDNEFKRSFVTEPKNEKVEMNNDRYNKVTETRQVDMESCGETFDVEQSVSENYPVSTIKNNVAGLYSCEYCEKQVGTSLGLKRHVESIHEGIRYSCNKCDYEASNKSHLTKHTQSIHERITYPCLQCNYKATEKGSLKRHSKTKHC